MMKIVSYGVATALGILLAGTAITAANAATAPKNVSDWAVNSQVVADAPESKTVKIALFLGFQHMDELRALVADISRPDSPHYRQYLTPDQFRARFGQDSAKVKLVQDTLKELGFKIEQTPKSGLYVEASGTVAQIKSAFKVSQKMYAVGDKMLRANIETPTLPAKIAGIVTHVAGLDESRALIHPDHVRPGEEEARAAGRSAIAQTAVPTSHEQTITPPPAANLMSPFCSNYWGDHTATLSTMPGPYPTEVPWLICGYTPYQLRQAYGVESVPYNGFGVTVAVVDNYASPTIVHDVNTYSKNHGLPPLTSSNFTQVLPVGIYDVSASDSCGPQGWFTEESLDIEAVHSVAPGASILYYANASCQDPINDAVYNIIDFGLANIITNSYSYSGEIGLPLSLFETEDIYFLQAAAEGISVLFSSGDDGDLAASNGIASGSWDATSPYVTAVGGTSLALKSDGSKQEWGWGDYRAYLANATVATDGKSVTTSGVEAFSFYSGSGGGPSLVELAPGYQSNVPAKFSNYTKKANGSVVALGAAYRVTPDVSMIADPYTGFLIGETYAITGDPVSDEGCKPINATYEYCEADIGGTSLASPAFAGVLALVDQALIANKLPTAGLVNPMLYALGGTRASSSGFSKSALTDVLQPASPTAVLRGYVNNYNRIRLIAINSTPLGTGVFEGPDTSYRTGKGYDMVTGNGTPNVPGLIQAFLNPPAPAVSQASIDPSKN